MNRAMSLAPLIGLFAGTIQAGVESEQKPRTVATCRQLISSRPAGRDASRPSPAFDFVDQAKLPAGARILCAAQAAGGAIWVVTDKGAFRSQDGRYVPLEIGPRRLEPGQPHVPADRKVRHFSARDWITS